MLEGPSAVPAANSPYVLPFHQKGVAGLQPGLPWARGRHPSDRLVERNVLLFNFYAAGASLHSQDVVVTSGGLCGSLSSSVICLSWNRGQCVSPYASCQFTQKCSTCYGQHPARDCQGESTSTQRPDSKRCSTSLSHSCSKIRRSETLLNCGCWGQRTTVARLVVCLFFDFLIFIFLCMPSCQIKLV